MEKPMDPYYEVFLSFRGLDTRNNITDILYTSLIDAGVQAFRDNEELRVGKEIGPELLQAIKQSKISIPIFSKRYAESEWCLMELVQMVECKEKWGQEIMPIFFDVKPSEVRNQTVTYGDAIQSHINKQLYTDATIQNWKAALNKVGALKGWELKDRGLGEFTREIVQKVLIKLKKNYLAVTAFLVEMEDQVDIIMELIGEQTTETKIVGIHGMGGVGKTTLAKIVYNKLLSDSTKHYNLSNYLDEMDYQGDIIMEVIGEQTIDSTKCCSLSNIGDTKIESLQNQLISDVLGKQRVTISDIDEGKKVIKELLSSKRVILLLDDVDHNTKLDALVGIDRCWFGRGSKVIITTRNKEVLKDVKLKHELTGMDFDLSLELFSKHAFRRDHPPAKYISLSKKAVEICGHLPLALEIIGSFLAGKDKNFWETTLEKLGTIPHENVEEKLNISIKALQPQAREIFLDVCCFFIGYDVRIVRHMWEICGFFPDYYLGFLQQMSLIKITPCNRLWMHDLLRDLGRDFVCQNGNYKPEKQSRLWDHLQANDVLMAKGTKNVEAIHLKFDHQFQDIIEKEEFESLSNLRILRVDCGDLNENKVRHFPSTNWFQKNPIMLPKLRWLSWHHFPNFLKLTESSLMKLVILDLSSSEITDDWEGWNHLKMAKNLKVLDLTKCQNLCKTPDFFAHENLEQLILQGCEELVQVDRSIGKLKHLVFLNLGGCRKLQSLPDEMGELEALTELLVDGTSITKIPEWKGMKKLETLSAIACESLSLCNFSGCLTSLINLRLQGSKITELPFGNFASLVELNLSWSKIQELPNSIEKMKNLRVLRMSYTPLEKLPSAIGMLKKLEEIYAHGCRNLQGEIPNEIGRISFLRILILPDTKISNVPKLPESMTNLCLATSPQMRYLDLSHLLNLEVLELDLRSKSSVLGAPSLNWIGALTKLESFLLCCDSPVTLPSDFKLLLKLRKLELIVNSLGCLPRLPQNLSYLSIHGRNLMERSIDLSYLGKLSELEVCNCEKLTEIQGIEGLKNLKQLYLYHLPSLVKLPNLTDLKKLRRLWISFCSLLVEVRGSLELLEELRLVCCKSLEKLSDPLSFKNIRYFTLEGCLNLKEIQALEDSENLSKLYLGDLPLLEKLPDLTNSKELKELSLKLRLVEIQGSLRSLEELQINHCGSLQRLSNSLSFKNLRYFTIKHCHNLKDIQGLEDLKNLRKLSLEDLPLLENLSDLTNSNELKELSLNLCPHLVEIQGSLRSLEELQIDHCGSLQMLSNSSSLKNLRYFTIKYCQNLKDIQGLEDSKNLRKLSLEDLPLLENLSDLTNSNELKELSLNLCPRLVEIRGTLRSLEELQIEYCGSLQRLSNSSSFKNLRYFTVKHCQNLKEIQGLEDSKNLHKLSLEDLPSLENLSDLTNSNELKELSLNLCPRLVEIRGMLRSLEELHIDCCRSLRKLSNPLSFKNIRYFTVKCCRKLKEIQGLEDSKNLRKLSLQDLPLLGKLSDLTNSNELKELSLNFCPRLVEIRGTLRSLEELHIDCCQSLRKLSNPLSFKNIRYFTVTCCWKLKEIQGLEDSKNLRKLSLHALPLLGKLSDLTNSNELKELSLDYCPRLVEIRCTLRSLEELRIDCCQSLRKLSNPLSFKNIRYFTIQWCPKLKEIQGLEDSKNLRELSLEGLPLLENLSDLTNSNELKEHGLNFCPHLVEIRGSFRSLEELYIYYCESLRKLCNPFDLKNIRNLTIMSCPNLKEIQGLEDSENLCTLSLEYLPLLENLSDLTNSNELKGLGLNFCPHLVEIRGSFRSLEELCIKYCKSLRKLCNPLDFKNIRNLTIISCPNLKEIQGLEVLENLRMLCLVSFPSLEKLLDLTNSKELKQLTLGHCPGLNEIQSRIESLEELDIFRCESLQKLSNPSSFKKLKYLYIEECEKFEETLESDEYRVLKKVRNETIWKKPTPSRISSMLLA